MATRAARKTRYFRNAAMLARASRSLVLHLRAVAYT
jgi:hypothetical protein